MKEQRMVNTVKKYSHLFSDEDFDPKIPSDADEEDTYEASRVVDEQLADTVMDLLSNSQMIDSTDIHVEVDQHRVTLIGTVPEESLIKQTEEAVKLVDGVWDVKNHLKVEPIESQPS